MLDAVRRRIPILVSLALVASVAVVGLARTGSEGDVAATRITAEPSVPPVETATPEPRPAAAEGTLQTQNGDPEPPDATPVSSPLEVTGTRVVARLTGAGSLNDTASRWNVTGTDLGHMFWHGGTLNMVFGDTWGTGGVEGVDWRSNVMARITNPTPRTGFRFDDMVTDGAGWAKELLPSRKIPGDEKTVIPTYGVSVGSRMYLHYMSVREWTSPGRWDANMAGLAYSDDGGLTWVKDPRATWPGTSNFVQTAMLRHEGYVYVFGIPAGRFGGVQLARVRPGGLLDPGAYAYWNGTGWGTTRAAAETIVPAPVGELSVRWSEHHEKWLMTYLNEERRAIVLRTADAITGPWDEERIVVTAEEHPQLYAPYMVPMDTGAEIHFTMSRFDSYQVFLLSATLE